MEVERVDPETTATTSDALLGDSPWYYCFPGIRSKTVKPSWWQLIHSNHRHEPRWWVLAFLKIREWSEIVAGPRWKTFIRRFNRDRRRGRGWDDSAKFQYDHLSYYLNFEDEDDDDDEAGLGGLRSFSMRYAAVPVASGESPAVK